MKIASVKLENFKNYENLACSFPGRVTCFAGPNGAGKTNLLDAIHYLCVGKSYFQAVDSLNIRHEMPFMKLEAEMIDDGTTDSIKCILERGKRKKLFRNQAVYERLSDHLGRYPVVMIAPDDLEIINGSSENRRKLIDFTISFTDRQYLNNLLDYNKVLSQRNSYLRQVAESNGVDKDLLHTLDEQLSILGHAVFDRRVAFFNEFIPIFEEVYANIAAKREVAEVVYQSSLQQGKLNNLLKNASKRDLILQRTTVGIHKDDIDCLIDGYSARKFGSQGQKKSFLVSLKIAQYHFLRQKLEKEPILLLDDLFAKLDIKRADLLLQLVISDKFGQVFITDTQEDRLAKILEPLNVTFEIKMLN